MLQGGKRLTGSGDNVRECKIGGGQGTNTVTWAPGMYMHMLTIYKFAKKDTKNANVHQFCL